MAETGPWEDYGSAVVADDYGPWSDYAAAPAAAPASYNTELSRRIANGDTLPQLEAFIRAQGADPAQVKNLAEAVAYRDDGGASPIPVYSEGAQLTAEPQRTLAERLHMGVGDVAQGVGDVLGIVANPLNAGINALTGSELGTDLGQTFRDLTGAPDAISDNERLASSINRGGAGGLATAGAGAAVAGVRGSVGLVGRELAANPVRDIIAGLAGGAGLEVGDRVAGTPGAVVGGLVGGFGGAAGASRAARLGERAAEAMTNRLPRAILLDEAGQLTEDAREIALRTGADLEEVRNIYARVRQRPEGSRSPRNSTTTTRAAASEQARAVGSVSRPVRGQPVLPVSPTATADLKAATQRIIDAIPVPERFPSGPYANRFEQARSEGVQLTRAQSEQDFDIYNDEQSLKVSATSEGNQAREFFANQIEQIKAARDRFLSAFGDISATPEQRGQLVREAVSDLRDAGAEGVRNLYRSAEALGGDGLLLETNSIREAATDVLIDEAVPEGVKRAVSQELARYGIIGRADPTNEVGLTRVALDDGSSVTFRGPVKTLTASNADDLRKAINRLYDPMRPNLSGQSIKPAIDDALEESLERAAGTSEAGIGEAYRAARDAFREQKRTFSAKDIVESLHASKKGTDTPVLLPDRAIAQVLGQGPKASTNLRQVKGLLLSSDRPAARQAWQAIKQQAIADIFGGAIMRNLNVGGEITDAISGAKLRTMIFDRFGATKLREVLDEDEFNQLMKLSRIIGDATIPMSGTTNPSGTFTKLVNFLGKGALKFTGGLGDAAVALVGKARDLATTRKTLAGITSYDGRMETGRRFDQQAREFIRQYVEDGQAGKLVPTGINLGSQTPRGRN